MTYDQTQVAFVDTETTGLDPEYRKIWDIAVIVDDVEHNWQQRFTPGGWWTGDQDDWYGQLVCDRVIDEWVLENTRLRQDFDYSTALNPIASIIRFSDLTRGRHIVGACPWFDSERLHRVILANESSGPGRDLPWHYHLIDVENLAVGYLAGQQAATECGDRYPPAVESLPWKSTGLSLALRVNPDDFEPKHSALADARWAKAMFEAIMGSPQ